MPPFGEAHDDSVIVDSREAIVLAAGAHEESIRLATADLQRVALAQIADICKN